MNGVVGESSQGEAGASEQGLDLVGGREAANSVEDVGGFFFGQHHFEILCISMDEKP